LTGGLLTGKNVMDRDDDDDQCCHCHGGRLVIVIGDSKNQTIAAARDWTSTLTNAGSPLYKMAFDVTTTSPHFGTPQVVTNGKWTNFPRASSEDKTAQDLRATWNECCYFNDVMIFAHGEKVAFSDLERLADMYFDRPIVRLILWLCAGNRDTFPFTGHRDTFGNLCYAVRPFDECPCGCDHSDCRSFSADGVAEKCPVGPYATTTIVSAGYYTSGKKSYSSKLSLDPNDATSPFVAPDSGLIDTTVKSAAGGATVSWSPQAVTGGNVFAGRNVKAPANPPGPAAGYGIDPASVLKPGTGKPAPGSQGRPEYEGPRWNDIDCPGADGCLQGAK
jgi:hypothetical protein